MHQVKWHQHFFDRCHRPAYANVALRESAQRKVANSQQVFELFDRIRSIVPEISIRMRRANTPRIRAGDIFPSGCDGLRYYLIAFFTCISSIGEILVAVKNNPLVHSPMPVS